MGTHKKTTPLPAQHSVHTVHTVKGEQTKRKLIRVAADLALRQGFRKTSLDEILREAAIPKGSLYFYFKNKAELGRAVIQYRRETLLKALRGIFQNSDATLKDQIKDWFAFMLSTQETSAGPLGCPLGNLAQELSREDEAFTQEVDLFFTQAQTILSQRLAEVQKEGALVSRPPAGDIAHFLLMASQGALLLVRVRNSVEPLLEARKTMLTFLDSLAPEQQVARV